MRQHVSGFVAMLFSALAAPAFAQNATTVAGVVQSVDGANVNIKTADGTTMMVKLAAEAIVTQNKKVDFSAVKSGDYIAAAAVQQADGKIHAQELRIFPESMRGIGEGHRPMSQPNQTMTNATVAEVVGTAAGGVVKTKYPGGTTDIIVDPATPITEIVTIDRGEVKPGASVSMRATPGADGSLNARFVRVQ
ncbi:MAG TPA: hypothetical protein VLV50_19775 [Stellaceae bacterium]|nr:hypothetical protein [Stellaceae bacterium]